MPENSVTSSSASQEAPWEKGIARVFRGVMYAGMVCVVLMMLLTVAHAIGRYFFNTPILGLVEMSQFLLVLVIFLLMPYTETAKNHLVIGIAVERLPQRGQGILNSLVYIISLLVLGVATYRAVERGIFQIHAAQTSMFLRIPHWPFFFLVAVCWVLLMLAILVNLIHFVRMAARGSGQ